MIFRIVTGGLGNQLWQYFVGRSIAQKRGLPVQFHVERATRDYMLDPYTFQVDFVERPTRPVYEEPGFAFDPNVYTAPEDMYYRGYWQSWKYLDEDLVRQELILRNGMSEKVKEVEKKLQKLNSVFVHIRRGDYLNPGTRDYHGVELKDYYLQASDYIKNHVKDAELFIFSDDPEWCELFFPDVISGFTPYEDLYLMSKCKHGIGANSSFSWWANWLGDAPGRINIAPKQWFVDKTINTNDLCPPHWIRL